MFARETESNTKGKYHYLENGDSSESLTPESLEMQTIKSNVFVDLSDLDFDKDLDVFGEQRGTTILGRLNYYLHKFGTFCYSNIKRIFAIITIITLTYVLVSWVDFDSVSTTFKNYGSLSYQPPSNHSVEINTNITYQTPTTSIIDIATPTPTVEYVSPRVQLLKNIEQHSDYKTRGLNFQLTSPAKLPLGTTVLQQLAKTFPYNKEEPIPKQIWQTWKVKIDDPAFPESFKNLSKTWTNANPDYIHHILTDAECDALIEELYSGVPDVIHAYKIMPIPILRIDFFRYLILFAKGGVYSDMDTKALKPIKDWASLYPIYLEEHSNPGFIVGVEADQDSEDWGKWFARKLQFCQWTFQSKKGHPILRELIARITEITLVREEAGQLDPKAYVMDWTGPGIFTDYVFDYANGILYASSTFRRRKYDTLVDSKFFNHMEQPIVIDDLMVLPITSFSPDIGWMGAKESTDPMAYVKHMFSGSWKVGTQVPIDD